MANLKEIRNRITSVGSTMQITSAMKMVSASKLRRAQDAIIQMRPYAAKLSEIMENLSGSLSENESESDSLEEVLDALAEHHLVRRACAGLALKFPQTPQ